MASKDPGFDLIQARHFCCSIHDSLKEQMYMLGKLAVQYEEQNFARYWYNTWGSVKEHDTSATRSKLPAKQLLNVLYLACFDPVW